MADEKTGHRASGTGGVSGGMNQQSIDEMKEKLQAERKVDTKGWNEQQLEEHSSKIERLQDEIKEAEKQLTSSRK